MPYGMFGDIFDFSEYQEGFSNLWTIHFLPTFLRVVINGTVISDVIMRAGIIDPTRDRRIENLNVGVGGFRVLRAMACPI